jgi:lipopolysaccharide transport system permease protein
MLRASRVRNLPPICAGFCKRCRRHQTALLCTQDDSAGPRFQTQAVAGALRRLMHMDSSMAQETTILASLGKAPRRSDFPGDYELVIESGRQDRHYWRDLWRYRELFRVLAWRDVSVRYKQTVIGVAWALLRPFLTMIVFTVVFGKIAQLPSGGTPYALLVFAGMLPWTLFSTSLSDASNSLISNANLIGKVYFPRLIIPVAAVVVSLIDFLISFSILIGLMIWYQYVPPWQFIFLPLFVLLAFFASLGPSLWIAALNVKYRDFRYIIPFIVQFGLYVSPVGFSSSVVPDEWRLLYSLNPMVGIIDGFRWCILGGTHQIYEAGLGLSVAVVGFSFWFGVRQFRSMERSVADII